MKTIQTIQIPAVNVSADITLTHRATMSGSRVEWHAAVTYNGYQEKTFANKTEALAELVAADGEDVQI